MHPEEKDLRQRTKEFALQIIRLFSEFPKTTEAQVLGKQVLPFSRGEFPNSYFFLLPSYLRAQRAYFFLFRS